MKRVFLISILFLPLLSFGQNFKKADLIGQWKIVKTEFYLGNKLIRKVYFKENTTETIVEGPNMGEMNEKFTELVKLFTGTVLMFNDDNSFTWDIQDQQLKLIDKYWKLLPNTNKIIINEWKDKAQEKNGLMAFAIVTLENDRMTLDANDSGQDTKYDLVRVK